MAASAINLTRAAADHTLFERWRYLGGKRDLRIDTLRGIAAVAMIVDHIGGPSSWLYHVTGGDRFFVSGAEIFVVISGLTAGLVYRRVIAEAGLVAGLRKVLRRVAMLYVLAIGLTFAFAAAGLLAGAPWRLGLPRSEVGEWAWSIITMRRTFYLTDILLLYVLLLAVFAPVLFALAKGHVRLVLLLSWMLWLTWQIAPGEAMLPWRIENNVMFHFPAWQVIFVTGAVIGFHADAVHRAFPSGWPIPVLVASAALLAALIALYNYEFKSAGLLDPATMLGRQFGDKADVRVGRIIALCVFFAFGYSALTTFWMPLSRAVGLLMPLGQHALTAYSLHLGIVALWSSILPTWEVPRPGSETAAIQSVGLGVVWLMIAMNEARTERARAARSEAQPERGRAASPPPRADSPPVPTPETQPALVTRVRRADGRHRGYLGLPGVGHRGVGRTPGRQI